MKKIAFFIFILAMLVYGCTSVSNPKVSDRTVEPAAQDMPKKPLSDSALITANVLDVSAENATLKIASILDYTPDHRNNSQKLSTDDIISFYFQWGTLNTTVDLPPIGPSNTDINLVGIQKGDMIQAIVSYDYSTWRVFNYEKLN
jgi:hypothetical protein